MVKYSCPKCFKQFSQKSHYTQHLKRKLPCKNNVKELNELVDKRIEQKFKELTNQKMVVEKTTDDIKTMRYLGNKTKFLDYIYTTINKYIIKHNLNKTICDGFGGTGCVTQYFNNKSFTVISNDINNYSFNLCFSRNNIISTDLNFGKLGSDNINDVLDILNKCRHKGFVYYNYSPNKELAHERKYFTNENAEIIDGIRFQLENWFNDSLITRKEYIHLIAILIETVSLHSNIPGTYGAFLNKWDSRALKKIELKENIHLNLLAHYNTNETYQKDLREIIDSVNTDILYIDPPYNERDYSMYYHVLETISKYNNPILKENKTGTKTKYNKSLWCNKKTAINELEYIIKTSKSKLIVMSYNNEGIIPSETIRKIFEKYGDYSIEKKEARRFKCNKVKSETIVYEYLHILEKRKTLRPPKPPLQENIIIKKKLILKKKYRIKINKKLTKVEEAVQCNRSKWGVIYNECCLSGMLNIPDESVDLICCDLPYGLTECKWDTPLNLDILWENYNRILKKNGIIILFGKQPFTSRLVASNYKMFKYSLVWHKSKPGGFAQAPYKVLCEHEDILIFTYGKTTKNSKNRMTYNPQGTKPCNKKMKGKTGNTEHRKGRKTQKDYIQTITNYPRSILNFKNEGKVKHPTQKPLKLIEYLIKTFSNENETVLDNCMGSGTTAVACINYERRYIGYETDKKFYDVCIERIESTKL